MTTATTTTDSPGARLPHVPNLLGNILGMLRHDVAHGFMLTDQPVHIPYLSSPALLQRAFQAESVTTSMLHPTDVTAQSVMQIRNFFLPTVTIGGLTFGFGAAYYDTNYGPGHPQFLPAHSFHNVRFIVDANTNEIWIRHDIIDTATVSLLYASFGDINSNGLRHHQYDIASFNLHAFNRAVNDKDHISADLIIPHMVFFSTAQVDATTTDKEMRNDHQIIGHESHSKTKKIKHPFDDTQFLRCLRQFSGAFAGSSTYIFFDKSSQVDSGTGAVHFASAGTRNVSLLEQLRDESLQRHARTIVELPHRDTVFISSMQQESSQNTAGSENFDSLLKNVEYCSTQTDTENREIFIPELDTSGTNIREYTKDRTAANTMEELYTSLILPLLNEEQGFSLSEEDEDDQAKNKVQQPQSLAPTNGEEHATTATTNTNSSIATTIFEKGVSVLTPPSVSPILEPNSSPFPSVPLPPSSPLPPPLLPLPETVASKPSHTSANSHTSDGSSSGQNQKGTMSMTENSHEKQTSHTEAVTVGTGSTKKTKEDEALQLRREMLRARRERNRASARKSNARVKKAREELAKNLELTKGKASELRRLEGRLRAENLSMRKQLGQLSIAH